MKDAFLQAMSRAANSVWVVTSDGPAGRAGVTVSAVTSVSVDTPRPSLLACIHTASRACELIQKNGVFCANLLSIEQRATSDAFAGRTGVTGAEKFEGSNWEIGETGAPMLSGALAHFDCEVTRDVLVGTHRIFIGETLTVQRREAGLPLVYFDRDYSAPTSTGS